METRALNVFVVHNKSFSDSPVLTGRDHTTPLAMGVKYPAPIHYVATQLNVAKAAVYLYPIR